MKTEKQTIKLTPEHRGKDSTTFTGRPQGEEVRKLLKLEQLDKEDNSFKIIIPSGTTSLNPSFYLGLFYPSIKRINSIKGFKEKYEVVFEESNPEIIALLEENLLDCEREANNELSGKTGLDTIF